MELHWATDYFSDGNAFGYSIHNREVRAALARAGVEFNQDAGIAFHVASPVIFNPVPNKINVLYVAWESDRLPEEYVERMRGADLIFVTAEFLKPIFKASFPNKPVHVAYLGVNTKGFPYVKRWYDKRRAFRYLWLGAPNVRKGFQLVLSAWEYFAQRDDVELYLKTTVTGEFTKNGNVIFDSRRLSRSELAELYRSAHAFVFPSYGEGFGLTMAEAMATGLPCLFTNWSAMGELGDSSCGYPLPYKMIETPIGQFAQCDLAELVVVMEGVRRNYSKALRKGRRGADRIRKNFTWEQTAKNILAVLSAWDRKAFSTSINSKGNYSVTDPLKNEIEKELLAQVV